MRKSSESLRKIKNGIFISILLTLLVSLVVFAVNVKAGEKESALEAVPEINGLLPDDTIIHIPKISIVCWIPMKNNNNNSVMCVFTPNSTKGGAWLFKDVPIKKKAETKLEENKIKI